MDLLEREEPMALLASVSRSAGRGRGGVVLVTGEAGIGKTALVDAFTGRLEGGRVLRGSCDDLSTPRPLGPLRDLAADVGSALAASLASSAAPPEIHDRLLAELRTGPPPAVLVLEDVHWADDATIDVITTVGRRIAQLPAVLVLTFRDGELAADHPLRAALAALPAAVVTRVPLAPLSLGAVTALVGADAVRVHTLTGGNPFYVTELLAARPSTLPPSVADAVQGRVATLGPGARSLLELVSVVPARIETAVLDVLRPDWTTAAEEPEKRRLLEVDPVHVGFRHELARTAVEAGLPTATRRRLHAEVLAVLRQREADPAELVHHAEAAGDDDALAAVALPAARRAAALGSNREAYAHYRRAARFADRLPLAERAALFEELAGVAYLVDRIPQALSAIETATAAQEALGDPAAVGRCALLHSRLRWYAGDRDGAEREAAVAVERLEPFGESTELARACSSLSQLAMLGDRPEESLRWGRRAADMAQRIGARAVHAHALVNLGTLRATQDPADDALLLEAFAAADACGERHEAVRALINDAWAQLAAARAGQARELAERAAGYAREHQVDSLGAYLGVTLAWLRLRAGDWAAAEAIPRAELARGASVTQLLARTVLAELAVRRGDPDADALLADAAAQAEQTEEVQRIGPVVQVQIERALLTGEELPLAAVERAVALAAAGGFRGWGGRSLAAWAAVAGVPTGWDDDVSPAYAAMMRRDWAAAAAEFGAVGWPFERALFLSLLDDRVALAEALEIARRLGARPLAGRVARRMRQLGLAVPHGRRESTRANPAGLTDRQLEVLELLAAGLSNVEIADQLVVSPRTVEHHVAALLDKLQVESRRDAVRRAGDLGVISS